jgi:hypothetical protein
MPKCGRCTTGAKTAGLEALKRAHAWHTYSSTSMFHARGNDYPYRLSKACCISERVLIKRCTILHENLAWLVSLRRPHQVSLLAVEPCSTTLFMTLIPFVPCLCVVLAGACKAGSARSDGLLQRFFAKPTPAPAILASRDRSCSIRRFAVNFFCLRCGKCADCSLL